MVSFEPQSDVDVQRKAPRRGWARRIGPRVGYLAVALTGLLVAASGESPAVAAHPVAAPADVTGSDVAMAWPYVQLVPSPQALSTPVPVSDHQQATTRMGSEYGIPAIVLDSYHSAQTALGRSDPECHLSWPMLAGIGKVESGNAEDGDVDSAGTMVQPLFGPVLDGLDGTAAIPATSDDAAGPWMRAEGPMQFLPSTWAIWGAGNPQNVYDASLAAGRYLCADGRDLATEAGLAEAILSYNHSPQYLDLVSQWIQAYRNGGIAVPDEPGIFDPSLAEGMEPQPPAAPAAAPAPTDKAGSPHSEKPPAGSANGAGKAPQPAPKQPQALVPSLVQGLLPGLGSNPNGLVSEL